MADPSYTGQLLVATPMLRDPNFARTVVLVLVHTPEGAMGVVLNRPTDTPVSEALPQWAPLLAEPGVVFRGGPVSPMSALGLAQAPLGAALPGWVALLGTVGPIDLDSDPDDLRAAGGMMRVFAGIAGWSPGQLDGEVDSGGWYVVDRRPGDLFDPQPDQLWRAVLRRQPGPLAWVSTFPSDPALN